MFACVIHNIYVIVPPHFPMNFITSNVTQRTFSIYRPFISTRCWFRTFFTGRENVMQSWKFKSSLITEDKECVLDEMDLLMVWMEGSDTETKGMQTQKHKQKQRQSTCKQRCRMSRPDHEHAHTLPDTRTHTNLFTLCLCGLSEPAKLSFLLLSEVSQRDPLVLPTCSSHSQTAEEAVSQYRNVRQKTAAIQTTVQTQLPCPEKLQNKCAGHTFP